tara:strand:+ start:594 stop:1040 length:447 start_codon:yes stop_codon:yes gene_type:complete
MYVNKDDVVLKIGKLKRYQYIQAKFRNVKKHLKYPLQIVRFFLFFKKAVVSIIFLLFLSNFLFPQLISTYLLPSETISENIINLDAENENSEHENKNEEIDDAESDDFFDFFNPQLIGFNTNWSLDYSSQSFFLSSLYDNPTPPPEFS